MATTDDELIAEVRSLTSFDESIIPPHEMQSLVMIAKNDIRGIANEEIPDIYEHQVAERAAFWTVTLFTKISVGELDAPDFSIGDIDVDSMPNSNITRVWYRQLEQYTKRLTSSGSTADIGQVERVNRSYDDDFNRQQF